MIFRILLSARAALDLLFKWIIIIVPSSSSSLSDDIQNSVVYELELAANSVFKQIILYTRRGWKIVIIQRPITRAQSCVENQTLPACCTENRAAVFKINIARIVHHKF